MNILSLETSCDETAAAVVKDGAEILASVVASSEELHQKTGGIVPEVAAREQIKCIIPVIDEALTQAFGTASSDSRWAQIDALAVTQSPGLIGSLVVGVETAKTLSFVLKKPLVPVEHLIAHLYANWLNQVLKVSSEQSLIPKERILVRPPGGYAFPTKGQKPSFPALGLIVSGGHTELLLMKDHGNFEWLGGTRDDAAGEAFDKAAKMLSLGYPGGPVIQKIAQKGNSTTFDFPRPMLKEDNLEFSFSGLKTSLYYLLKKKPELLENEQTISDLAASYQQAIVDVLVEKTRRAAQKEKVKSIVLGGGVSANLLLRQEMSAHLNVPVYFPPLKHCTDNAAIVACCAYYNYKPERVFEVVAEPGFRLSG